VNVKPTAPKGSQSNFNNRKFNRRFKRRNNSRNRSLQPSMPVSYRIKGEIGVEE